MRKSYLMMAAAATMLAACTQTDFVNEVPAEAPKAIEFENGFVNKTTRATENNQEGYSESFSDFHKDFFVWGYKSLTTGYQQVFNKEKVTVTKSDAGEAYTYEGLVAWDKAADHYKFYAAAPANHTWNIKKNDEDDEYASYLTTSVNLTGTDINEDQPTHNVVLNTPDNSKDLLIADDCQPVMFQDVQLNFIHILSRLNIKVTRPQDLTRDLIVYEVGVKNILVEGDFDESLALPNNNGSIDRWLTKGNRDNTTYVANFGDNGLTVALGADRNVMQALVVPQSARWEAIPINGSTTIPFQEPYLYIKYGLANDAVEGGVEKFEQYYNLAAAFNITEGNALPFYEGWENTLTITVNSKAIGFTSKVSSWSTKNGTHILQ